MLQSRQNINIILLSELKAALGILPLFPPCYCWSLSCGLWVSLWQNYQQQEALCRQPGLLRDLVGQRGICLCGTVGLFTSPTGGLWTRERTSFFNLELWLRCFSAGGTCCAVPLSRSKRTSPRFYIYVRKCDHAGSNLRKSEHSEEQRGYRFYSDHTKYENVHAGCGCHFF